ncbi:hypothetical protein F5884DRAFT_766839 [Xylogone sp. PMI_703]|nr:hypothetical protein F5884DRAFT_766839 [Xylogone sp. PMI_703]
MVLVPFPVSLALSSITLPRILLLRFSPSLFYIAYCAASQACVAVPVPGLPGHLVAGRQKQRSRRGKQSMIW